MASDKETNKNQDTIPESVLFSANRLLTESETPLTSENLTNILKTITPNPDTEQIEQYITKQKRLQPSSQPTNHPPSQSIEKIKTADGLLLTIAPLENGDYSIYLEENLKTRSPKEKNKGLENLVNAIGFITTIKNRKEKYLPQKGSGAIKLVTLRVSELKENLPQEEKLLQEIQLYRNLQKRLGERIKKVGDIFSSDSLEDIEFYTHLETTSIYKKVIKLSNLAYGMRELYGLIKVNSEIKRSEIISSNKTRKVSEQRRIAMFILKHKYDLSYPDIGKVLGEKGNPKNHATAILSLREKYFNMKNFNQEKYASLDIPEAYQEAKKRQIKK